MASRHNGRGAIGPPPTPVRGIPAETSTPSPGRRRGFPLFGLSAAVALLLFSVSASAHVLRWDTPTVTLAVAPGTITESGGLATVTATLDHGSSAATTVTVGATAGTNAAPGDFRLSAAPTLTIAAGNTTSTGTVTAVDNSKDEADKTVVVAGTATNSQGITQPASVDLTITDDDGAPALSIDAPRVREGDSGAANLTFTVTLSPASGRRVTVGYAEGTGCTATSGTDYTALAAGTLTFAAGVTSQTVTVAVTGDTTDEPARRWW